MLCFHDGHSSPDSALDEGLSFNMTFDLLKPQTEDLRVMHHQAPFLNLFKAPPTPSLLLPSLSRCHLRSSGACTSVMYWQRHTKSVTIATEPRSRTTDRQDDLDAPNISDGAFQSAHANASALSGGQCAGYINHQTFLPGRCFQQWPLNRNSEARWAGEARVNKNTTHRPGPSPAAAALNLQHV